MAFRVSAGNRTCKALNFTLRLKEPERRPDLYIRDLHVDNDYGYGYGYEGLEFLSRDRIDIDVRLENGHFQDFISGTGVPVTVDLHYARETQNFTEWFLLARLETPNEMSNWSYTGVVYRWDTSELDLEDSEKFRFKAVVDPDDIIFEWNETNNELAPDSQIEIWNETLFIPEVHFVGDIIVEHGKPPLLVDTDVEIDVLLENSGLGDASAIRVLFYLDGIQKRESLYFHLGSGERGKLSDLASSFYWSPYPAGHYEIKLKITYYDRGRQEYTEEIETEIEVNDSDSPPPPPPPPTPASPEIDWVRILAILGGGFIIFLVFLGVVFRLDRGEEERDRKNRKLMVAIEDESPSGQEHVSSEENKEP